MVILLHASIAPNAMPTRLNPVQSTSDTLTPLMTILFLLILEDRARVHHAQQEVQYILCDEPESNALLESGPNVLHAFQ